MMLLDYCKTHSSKETYNRVAKSLKLSSLTVLLICVVFCIVFSIELSLQMNAKPENITIHGISYETERTGRIGYDDLFYTYNKSRYDIDIADYGYSMSDFELYDTFSVYLDKNEEVVDIVPQKDIPKSFGDYMIYVCLGTMLVFIIILLVYAIWSKKSKSRLNPAREWVEYCNWYRSNDRASEWYEIFA